MPFLRIKVVLNYEIGSLSISELHCILYFFTNEKFFSRNEYIKFK